MNNTDKIVKAMKAQLQQALLDYTEDNQGEHTPVLKACTADEWAETLSSFRTYQTEYCYGEHSVMYSKIAQGALVGAVVGEVHYCANGDKYYYVVSFED